MRTLAPDTHPDAEVVLIEGYRRMGPEGRLARMAELTEFSRTAAMDAMRRRWPDISEGELKARFIIHVYGEELAEAASEIRRRTDA